MVDVDLVASTSDKEQNIFLKASTDPVMLADIIYAICKPQADEKNITDEQFGGLLNGNAIAEATEAFIEELIDFFPPAKQGALRKMTEKVKTLETKGMDYAINLLDSQKLDQKFQEELDKNL